MDPKMTECRHCGGEFSLTHGLQPRENHLMRHKNIPEAAREAVLRVLSENGISQRALDHWRGTTAIRSEGGVEGGVKAEGSVLHLDGPIVSNADAAFLAWFGMGAISPESFRNALNGMSGEIQLRMNSPGGSTFAEAAIKSDLFDWRKDTEENRVSEARVVGICASAACGILFGSPSTRVTGVPGSVLMIHPAAICGCGESDQLRQWARVAEKSTEASWKQYARARRMDESVVRKDVLATSWMDPSDAVERGYFDAEIDVTEDGDEDPGVSQFAGDSIESVVATVEPAAEAEGKEELPAETPVTEPVSQAAAACVEVRTMKWNAEKHSAAVERLAGLREKVKEQRSAVGVALDAYEAAESAFSGVEEGADHDAARDVARSGLEMASMRVRIAQESLADLNRQVDECSEEIRGLEAVRPKGRARRQNVGQELDLVREVAKAGGLKDYKDEAVAEKVRYTDWTKGRAVQTNDLDAERLKDFLVEEGMAQRATKASSAANVALTPPEVGEAILYSLTDFGGLLQHVNLIRTPDGHELRIPNASDAGTVTWTDELAVVAENNVGDPTYSSIKRRIGHLGYHTVSTQALQDPQYDVTGHVLNTFAEREAKAVNLSIWRGTGSANKQPTGILTALKAYVGTDASRVQKTGAATAVSQANIKGLTKETAVAERYFEQTLENAPGAGFRNASPPAGFGGTPGSAGLFMRRSTYLDLIGETATDTHYLVEDAVIRPMSVKYLWDRPVILVEQIDAVPAAASADAYPVLYGNLGYFMFRMIGGTRIRVVDGLAAANVDGIRFYGFLDADGGPASADLKWACVLQAKA